MSYLLDKNAAAVGSILFATMGEVCPGVAAAAQTKATAFGLAPPQRGAGLRRPETRAAASFHAGAPVQELLGPPDCTPLGRKFRCFFGRLLLSLLALVVLDVYVVVLKIWQPVQASGQRQPCSLEGTKVAMVVEELVRHARPPGLKVVRDGHR